MGIGWSFIMVSSESVCPYMYFYSVKEEEGKESQKEDKQLTLQSSQKYGTMCMFLF